MSAEGRARTMLVIIGEGDPGDLSKYSISQLEDLKVHVRASSHRDRVSAIEAINVLETEKRKED